MVTLLSGYIFQCVGFCKLADLSYRDENGGVAGPPHILLGAGLFIVSTGGLQSSVICFNYLGGVVCLFVLVV